ncbi:MAG: cell division protein, partial [Methanomicrobiales archaeon]|nr:cell division protein [Methanomicrobiales archaeon]
YAAENLPSGYLNFLDRWRPASYFIQSHQTKASRIVSLAKKAIYEEVSIPCDLTSADKALVLIAGPSQEPSMRGFQTVRKWIDRSIAGLEMRSGDYPIPNTRYVGIIIMLSGMQNIPRLDELAQAREEYRVELEQENRRTEEELPGSEAPAGAASVDELGTPAAPAPVAAAGELKDRTLTLTGMMKSQKAGRSSPLFEGLNMSMGKVRGVGDTQGKEGGTPTDITRKTVVKGGQAPKDTVFGLKDIRVERGTAKAGAGEASTAAIPRATRPRDEALEARDVRFRQADKAKDGSLVSRDVQVRSTGIRPIDSSLLTPGKGKVPAAGKPRELDPGKRRIDVIEPSSGGKEAGKPEKKPRGRGKKDDEEIGWIH